MSSNSESAAGRPPLWGVAWTPGEPLERLATHEQARAAYGRPGTRIWLDLEEPEHRILKLLGEDLGLHDLIVEDISERNQRAKVERTGDVLHLVMFALQYAGEIVAHEVDIVVGERFLITVHEAGLDPRSAPFTRRDVGDYLAGGTDFLLWAIADWLVDAYFPVFDRLGDEIDQLGDDVMRRPSSWLVERLFGIRRELLVIRHAVTPQREIYNQLTNRDLKLIQPERLIYFRDVYDHLIRLTDELDSYREMVGTTLDIYLSQVNNNLSEVMKRLTAVTAVLAGAGAVAGIFGMSEAGLALSFTDARFWIVALAILFLSALGIVYFRRIGWI